MLGSENFSSINVMTPNNARKLVAKVLPGYQVKAGQTTGEKALADSATQSAVEIVSPSLRSLKRRYFGDNAATASAQVAPDSEDSGMVVVEKGGAKSASQAVVFSKGKIIGRQG